MNQLHIRIGLFLAGLLDQFYKPRWQRFFRLLQSSLRDGTSLDLAGFEKDIRGWEWRWVNEESAFPVAPAGDSRELARSLYRKYRQRIAEAYEGHFLN